MLKTKLATDIKEQEKRLAQMLQDKPGESTGSNSTSASTARLAEVHSYGPIRNSAAERLAANANGLELPPRPSVTAEVPPTETGKVLLEEPRESAKTEMETTTQPKRGPATQGEQRTPDHEDQMDADDANRKH